MIWTVVYRVSVVVVVVVAVAQMTVKTVSVVTMVTRTGKGCILKICAWLGHDKALSPYRMSVDKIGYFNRKKSI
jgi:hypothetical protein